VRELGTETVLEKEMVLEMETALEKEMVLETELVLEKEMVLVLVPHIRRPSRQLTGYRQC
jgi:hypothetical protein